MYFFKERKYIFTMLYDIMTINIFKHIILKWQSFFYITNNIGFGSWIYINPYASLMYKISASNI